MTASQGAILFVCLGNICRSPLAEGAMRAEAEARSLSLKLDSAGTGGWHIGNPPDQRAQEVAQKNGVDISDLRARQVQPDDFHQFDLIVALDQKNHRHLEAMRPADAKADLTLLLDLVPGREGEDVLDPYYEGGKLFDKAWADVRAGARAIADRLATKTRA